MKKWTYGARFFLSVNLGFSLYINSSFLSSHISERYVGLVFSLAAILAIAILFKLPDFISRYGNVHLMAALGFVSILIIPPLVTSQTTALTLGLFIAYYVIGLMLRYGLDLYLEHLSDDETTGATRGTFLVAVNSAIMLSALSVGFLLGETDNYARAFFVAAIALLPFMAIMGTKLKEVKDHYAKIPIFLTLKKIFLARKGHDGDLHKILAIDLLLNLFYMIMIIYTPIYLHQYIGLSWPEIGIAFAIMNVPFIILPIPLGRLADNKIGEKELLSLGIAITGLATIAMTFSNAQSLLTWAVILTIGRIGVSIIESMKEVYLFKNITPGDVSILSISRNTIPLAYIIGPLIASSFLSLFDFRFLFAFIGLVMIFGLRYSLTLVDTK